MIHRETRVREIPWDVLGMKSLQSKAPGKAHRKSNMKEK